LVDYRGYGGDDRVVTETVNAFVSTHNMCKSYKAWEPSPK